VPAFRVHRVGLSKKYSQWPQPFKRFSENHHLNDFSDVILNIYLKVWQQV
jgi:hypothetical protein